MPEPPPPPDTHTKEMVKTKSKRRKQPPPELYGTEDEEGLSPQEEPDLKLVTMMLADINTKLAAHDAKLAVLTPHLVIPSDQE